MAAGLIAGTLCGGLLLKVVPAVLSLLVLAAILVISAIKVWRHAYLDLSCPCNSRS